MLKIVSALLLALSSSAFAEWTHQSELGVTDVQGQQSSSTIVAKHKSVKSNEKNTYTAAGDYSYGTNDDDTTDNAPAELTIRNWNALLRYDRVLTDHFSWFVKASVFGDRFQNVIWRASYDIPGITYHFWKKTEANKKDFFYVDLAYRFSQEELDTPVSDPDYEEDNSNAYIAFHYSKAVSKTLIFVSDLDYTKRFTGDERSITNLFLGVENQLSDTFALKTGYKVSIDSGIEEPNEDTQRTLTINLLANY